MNAISLAKDILALENDRARVTRDANFYHRVLVQICLQHGGSFKIDPSFGEAALNNTDTLYIGGDGLRLLDES